MERKKKAAEDGSEEGEPERVEVTFSGGIRYTVPAMIAPSRVRGWLKIRFRVGEVMKDRKVVLSFDGKPVLTKKRRVMAPGEMEEIVVTEKAFAAYPDLKTIEIKVEESE